MMDGQLQTTVYSGKRRIVILAASVLLYFLQSEVRFLPSPLMQELAADFGVPLTVVGNLLSVCALAAAISTFGISLVVEWLGSVRLMAAGALCTAAAGLITAWTQNFSVAVFASVFCGVCQGVLECAGVVLVAELFEEKRRAMFCGMVCALSQISCSVSYTLPVVLQTAVGGWRHLELLWGALAVLTAAAFFACGRAERPVGVSRTAKKMTAAGILQALRFRFVLLTVLTMVIFIWVNNHFAIYLPTYLMEVRGFSETQAGLATSVMYAGGFVGGMTIGSVSAKGRRRLYRFAPVLMLAGGLALILFRSMPAILLGAMAFTCVYQMWVPLSLSSFMNLDGMTMGVLAGATALFNGSGHLFTGFIPSVFTWELRYMSMQQAYLLTVGFLVPAAVLTAAAGKYMDVP